MIERDTDLQIGTNPPCFIHDVSNCHLSVVYLEDCVQGLKRFADNYFDLAIVDPPYGIGADKAQNNAAMQRIKADGKSKAGRGWKLYDQHYRDWETDRKSTRLNSSHRSLSRMPSSA